jgi:hypothetical protein
LAQGASVVFKVADVHHQIRCWLVFTPPGNRSLCALFRACVPGSRSRWPWCWIFRSLSMAYTGGMALGIYGLR